MVVSSRAWCEDGLRRALDELDALRAMYAADEDAGSATSTRHPSSSSDPTSTSAETNDVAVTIARDALRAAVPRSHCAFLRQLEWVCDLKGLDWGPGRLVCVHAGLVAAAPLTFFLKFYNCGDMCLQPLRR